MLVYSIFVLRVNQLQIFENRPLLNARVLILFCAFKNSVLKFNSSVDRVITFRREPIFNQ